MLSYSCLANLDRVGYRQADALMQLPFLGFWVNTLYFSQSTMFLLKPIGLTLTLISFIHKAHSKICNDVGFVLYQERTIMKLSKAAKFGIPSARPPCLISFSAAEHFEEHVAPRDLFRSAAKQQL